MTYEKKGYRAEYDHNNWRSAANCKDVGPNIFFPEGSEVTREINSHDALIFCGGCAVSEYCLEFALATNQEDGVWGGMTEAHRRSYRRKWLTMRYKNLRNSAS